MHTQPQPESHYRKNLFLYFWIAHVQVSLLPVKTVPAILARQFIVGPNRIFFALEYQVFFFILPGFIRPYIIIAEGRLPTLAGLLEPGMMQRGMVHYQINDHAQTQLFRLVEELRK